MLRSMTGFASISGDDGTVKWDLEARAVNGKGLDLRLRLPEGAEALEPIIRKSAAKVLSRGSVTVTLRMTRGASSPSLQLDRAVLDAALAALSTAEESARDAGIDLAAARAADILALPGVLGTETGTMTLPESVHAAIPELFVQLLTMRETEGAALSRVISQQLSRMEKIVSASAVTAEARMARAGDILKERVAALLDMTDRADDDRLQQELAILAVKADVTEEIDRLSGHIAAAREMLAAKEPVGRKLDFLMQEFNREANTLCSKSGSADLTALGLELKVLIDQMREQVQNLE